MSYNGSLPPAFVERCAKIATYAYVAEIKNNCLPIIAILRPGGKYVFQEDGSPARTSRNPLPSAGQANLLATPLLCPAASPDLRVLHYWFWADVGRRVKEAEPKTELDLKVAIQKATRRLSAGVIQEAIDNFPKRAHMCSEAQGGHFEFKK